jgi:hypothetical protein
MSTDTPKSSVRITSPKAQTPTDTQPFGTLSIDLNIREAKALYALCQRIGGDPDRDISARGIFDEISKALADKHINAASSDFLSASTLGTLTFRNY